MRTGKPMSRILAVVLFKLLAVVQQILVRGRRTLDGLISKTDDLGHFLANRLLVKQACSHEDGLK